MSKQYYVYILTNSTNRVLYIGVTNDLIKRIYEHKNHFVGGFIDRYNVTKLVYYEVFGDAYSAISPEKQLKGGSRRKKTSLIEVMNPPYNDLYSTLV